MKKSVALFYIITYTIMIILKYFVHIKTCMCVSNRVHVVCYVMNKSILLSYIPFVAVKENNKINTFPTYTINK